METEPVFVALIEVRPIEGCPLNPGEIAGAAVRCYLSAKSNEEAKKLLKSSLTENHFELVEIEWCVNEAEVEWENPDDQVAEDLIQQARKTRDVCYGEFHVWGH